VPASSAADSRLMLGEPLRFGLRVWLAGLACLFGRSPPAHYCEDVQVPASTSTRQIPSSFRLSIHAATCRS
jgi:hypothetical protein